MYSTEANHTAIKAYYKELQQLSLLDVHKRARVSPAFANLLRACGKRFTGPCTNNIR
jgi:hypothetical protein